MSMNKVYHVKFNVKKFHRASKFRPVTADWTICDYKVKVKCSGCEKIQGCELELGVELRFECEECASEGSMKVVKIDAEPASISAEGVWVTVTSIRVEGCFTLQPSVAVDGVIWKCDIQKKNNPRETVVREFILENGGFIDGQEHEDVDTDDEEPSGWDKDDSDRPCIRLVSAKVDIVV